MSSFFIYLYTIFEVDPAKNSSFLAIQLLILRHIYDTNKSCELLFR